MANVKILEIHSTIYSQFHDSHSFINELLTQEIATIEGGRYSRRSNYYDHDYDPYEYYHDSPYYPDSHHDRRFFKDDYYRRSHRRY